MSASWSEGTAPAMPARDADDGYVFRRSERGWVRRVPGELRADGAGPAWSHVVDADDVTPNQSRGEYHSACGWCYLGAMHSQAMHSHRVERDG